MYCGMSEPNALPTADAVEVPGESPKACAVLVPVAEAVDVPAAVPVPVTNQVPTALAVLVPAAVPRLNCPLVA